MALVRLWTLLLPSFVTTTTTVDATATKPTPATTLVSAPVVTTLATAVLDTPDVISAIALATTPVIPIVSLTAALPLSPPVLVAAEGHQAGNLLTCLCCHRLRGEIQSRLQELSSHTQQDHSLVEEHVLKELVKTWFEANFRILEKSSSTTTDEQEFMIPKGKFLKNEINPFLLSLGFGEWTQRTKLYKDWFLRELLNQTEAQIRQARPWTLARKLSKSGLLEGLEGYCAKLREGTKRDYHPRVEGGFYLLEGVPPNELRCSKH
jgi:hypothetical protein